VNPSNSLSVTAYACVTVALRSRLCPTKCSLNCANYVVDRLQSGSVKVELDNHLPVLKASIMRRLWSIILYTEYTVRARLILRCL
jgi:hypothetical protein